jgi:hypothetical protein
MTEISTRVESVGDLPNTVPGTEPRLSLSELQNLLRAAADIERARRPVVVYAATQTLAAIDVRVPAPPVALDVAEHPERRRTLAEWLGLLGLAVAGGAFTTMTALALAGGPGIAEAGITAVGGLAVSLGGAIASSNAADRHQAQAWTQWTEAHR